MNIILNKCDFILPLLVFPRLLKTKFYQYQIHKAGFKVFTYNNLKQLLKNKKNENFYLIGPGPTLNELKKSQFQYINQYISFATDKVIYKGFTPDILIMEFSPEKNQEESFRNFNNEIKKDVYKYKNTLFLFEVNQDRKFYFHKYIIKNFPLELKNNSYFLSSFISPSYKKFPQSFLKNKFLLFFIKKLNIFWHCRSSVFYGAIFALFLKSKNLYLVGIDGFSGYFQKKDTFGDSIPSRCLELDLHSSSNPKYGRPTITDALLAISSYIKTYVVSNKVLLNKYLEFRKIPSK